MCTAVVAEVIQHDRRVLSDLVALGVLAVEDTQGVFLQSPEAGLTEAGFLAFKVGPQRRVVFLAAGGAADGVDLQRDVLNAQDAEEVVDKGDNFRVGRRGSGAKQLHAQLMEFAHPSCLRFFSPEAGKGIRQLDRQHAVNQPALDDCAVDAGGAFGPQREVSAALVGEGVHFLLDDVGGVADRTDKQPLVLKGRNPNLTKAVQLRRIDEKPLDKLPFVAFGREHVRRALDRFDF